MFLLDSHQVFLCTKDINNFVSKFSGGGIRLDYYLPDAKISYNQTSQKALTWFFIISRKKKKKSKTEHMTQYTASKKVSELQTGIN